MQKTIESAWQLVISGLGYDTTNAHLRDSPARVARFMTEWHTEGKPPPKLTVFPNEGTDQIVGVGGITFHSLCAHHGLPFFGVAGIGYIPGDSVLGLSKFARVVDHFAHRFQVQEQLTTQIADYLEQQLKPLAIGVVMRGEHLCKSMRGVCKPGHFTVTSDLRGAFRENASAKAELLELIKKE